MNLPFRSFRDREYCFLLSLFSSKKALEIKEVWGKHFNFTSVILSICRDSWKVPENNFVFSYCCKLKGYTFTTKVIKITTSYQMFQPKPQLATMQSYYFKKHVFFQHSLSRYFCRLYCWLLHYISIIVDKST